MRFRGQLLLALIMAFADAQTLVFSAVMQLRVGMQGWTLAGTVAYAGPATLAAAVMVLTVWGLYHLRTWALILNLLANFAIAYLALSGTLNVAGPVAMALAATAAIQAFLPVPILAMALGERRAGQPILRGTCPQAAAGERGRTRRLGRVHRGVHDARQRLAHRARARVPTRAGARSLGAPARSDGQGPLGRRISPRRS